VLAPSALRLIYRTTNPADPTLRIRAADVVASRLDMYQLQSFSKNALPAGYVSAVYQAKSRLVIAAHKKELEDRDAALQMFKGPAEDWYRECWLDGCRPGAHKCKNRGHFSKPASA
jgi:hypothetical protein